MSKKLRRGLSFLLSMAMLLGSTASASALDAQAGSASRSDGMATSLSTDYTAYLQAYETAERGPDRVELPAASYASYEGVEPTAGQDCILIPDNSSVTWEVRIQKAGLYQIGLEYAAAEGKGLPVERAIYIDGQLPFGAANALELCRIFTNESDFHNAEDEYRPTQVEEVIFSFRWLTGSGIESDTTYWFWFDEGVHQLTLGYVAEPIYLKSVTLGAREEVGSYADYCSRNPQQTVINAAPIRLQGENARWKSDASLFPQSDRSSPANEPIDVHHVKLNVIGSESWSAPKQWLAWEFEVEESGWYQLSIRLRQNFSSGSVANRALYIDGELPFAECAGLSVEYNRKWSVYTPGNDSETYYFYLEAGNHTVTLYNTIGSLAQVLNRTNAQVSRLNDVYRQIMMITGTNPDTIRDYHIDDLLPECMEELKAAVGELREICAQIEELTGGKGTGYGSVQKLLIQVEGFVKKPGSIPARLDTFRSNLSDVSSWVLDSINQPLTVDYLEFAPIGTAAPKADANFFEKLWFSIRLFFLSFTEDYNTVSSEEQETAGEEITIWLGATAGATSGANVIGGGRDQANALKSLIDNYFTPRTGIRVNVRLVDMSSLLPAVASGSGPDLAIGQDRAMPMNYAYRGALVDLSQFADCEEVLQRFFPEAVVSFRSGDQVYALPETFDFSLMFYRTDVLEELGEEPPQTWSQLYKLIPKLSNKNMTLGLPLLAEDNIELYLALLYQNGGQVYNDDHTATLLDTETSIRAFGEWTDFYTKYGVDQQVNLLTRFRTGESPIVITKYSFYNQLVAAAPELNGKWAVTLVPGYTDDGENNVFGTGTGAVIFENSQHQEAAWEFLKWWTEADTQVAFNRELEAILGESARIPTANMEALSRFPWKATMLQTIQEQAQYAKGLPEVPGSYLTTRYLAMAARLVINNGVLARDAIMSYAVSINDEITAMREEFGLND